MSLFQRSCVGIPIVMLLRHSLKNQSATKDSRKQGVTLERHALGSNARALEPENRATTRDCPYKIRRFVGAIPCGCP
ncbi:hypothetical protein BGP_0895 [Beggiatoa sp. PS]|nr:hypothetical protein BGP_0895 [Beggiatoa sp. PS]